MEMVHFIPPSQRRLAMLAAQADTAPVLIYGSSGTGKSGIARWIHGNSPRSARPLVVANRERPLNEQIPLAQGGTLLVTEIGEWPLGEQMRLLNFLTTKSIPHPGGEAMPMLLNVRTIATTSQTLEGRAQSGMFNSELLAKLNVFRLEMPELRNRQDEFEDIALGILAEIARELRKEHLRELTPDAIQALREYDWPANVRELRNVLRVAVIAAKGDRVTRDDLPAFGHDRIDFRATREQFEKIYILELLRTFNWEIEKTCQMSRMDKPTLLSKMKKYGIRPAETRAVP